MSIMKRLARIAVAAILATGIAAGTAAPSDAARHPGKTGGGIITYDTGWP